MRGRRLVVVLVLMAACQSSGPTSPPSTSAGAPPTQAPANSPAGAGARLEISNDLLDRYFGFEKEHRQIAQDWVTQKQGQINILNLALELEPKVQDLRRKWKLTSDEQHTVEAMVGSIGSTRQMWDTVGKKQVDALEKQLAEPPPKIPANIPPELKVSYEQMLEGYKKNVEQERVTIVSLRRAGNLGDIRDKYGSATVDYAITNGGDLVSPYGTWLAAAIEKARPHK